MKIMKIPSLLACSLNAFLIVAIATMCSCDGGGGDDPGPAPDLTEAEQALIHLSARTWSVKSVTIDGQDKTSSFTSMTLKFNPSGTGVFNGTFSASNGGVVWPASGSWNLDSATGSSITRGDGVLITITELTETAFKMTFTWNKTTLGPGRIASVKGQYVFSMGL